MAMMMNKIKGYRTLHKKCKWCKYYRYNVYIHWTDCCYGECILKDKIGINNNDIIAFGDGLNDVVMIENVGFGVAMKNALDEVKNKANDITLDDNNNDGVVNYLKSILK